jgi:hypothetical protein
VTPREPAPPRSLVELQSVLGAAFSRRDPVGADPAIAAACARFVAPKERLTPAEQVDIYRRQYWARLDEVLRDDFVGLHHVLGDEGWDALVRDYLSAHPSRSPSLRGLGAKMAAFLDGWPALPAARADLARDMARYELAFSEVFDGAEPPPLPAHKVVGLSAEAWTSATIVLSPLVHRMRLRHAVHVLRKAVRAGESPPRPAPTPVALALFRRELVVHYEELTNDQYAMLEALGRGASLVDACRSVAEGKADELADELAADVGGWFQRWASWGFVADVVVPG